MERYTLRTRAAPSSSSFLIDYAAELNPAQHAAVIALDGPFLVVAGAGSGKTRTLVYRVARLVESGVDPHRVLLLTFTRRAAGEMLRRASRLLDGRCEQVAGGTFHSFANSVLRRWGEANGIARGFTILDRSDSEDAVNLLRARLGLDKAAKRFPRKQTIISIFSMAVNKSRSLSEEVELDYAHLIDNTDDLSRLREAYTKYKRERHLLDYDDLLLHLRDLLEDHPDVRAHLGDRHRFLMVDEYQDTNRLQAEIVQLLAAAHGNVMVVGDDAQSIYSFRGADFRNIMDFPRLFPGTRIITLEENYRSTQRILDATNAIIAAARERYTKQLFTRRTGGEPPLLVATRSEQLQSRFVCQRVLELREEGVPLTEIAVLFRSGFHSFDLEIELARHNLPFVKRGGFKFIESAHIKDVVAHLRIVANPSDAVSWHRVLLLIEGVGPRTSEEILAAMAAGRDATEILAGSGSRGSRVGLEALAALYRRLRETESPADQIGEVLRYYDGILKRVYRDDYPKRQRDLEQFGVIASRYTDLETFLADMALEPPGDTVDDVLAADADEGRLTLSTIHSAKGLEWHTVFVIWVADGKFPSTYSQNDPGQLEEERRLLYVAATRAKDLLYLAYPTDVFDRSSGAFLTRPSRFVEEIPESALKRVMVVEEAAAEATD